jgi:SSS family solute:Na+ symporter
MDMNWLDGLIPLIYLVAIVGVAWASSRRVKTPEDLFLAGRGLGFGVIGLSLFASNISSTTLIGLSGAAYTSGIAVANYEWMAAVVMVFAAMFLIPVYLRNRCRTVPEFLGLRYSLGIRHYVSAWMIGLSVLVDTAGSLFAGALVLQVLVPGLPLWPVVVGLGLFAGLYTLVGGLRAVMITDALQAIILIAGSSVIAWMVFKEFDFSWAAATTKLPDGHLSLVRPATDPSMPWTGLVVGVPILGLYYWSMNHYISQRFFAAQSEDHARWGAILAAALKLLPLFIMVLPGAMALSLYPSLSSGDQVFPTLVRELLPTGFRGLVLAALLAAIMSTIDSTINAAAALVHYDFMSPAPNRGASRGSESIQAANPARANQANRSSAYPGHAGLPRARVITLVFMIIAIAWAPAIQGFPGLFAYLQQMFAVAVPPFVVVYFLGLGWKRANVSSAWWCLVVGHGLGLGFVVATQYNLWDLHFLETAGFTTALCLLVQLVVARVGGSAKSASEDVELWSKAMLPMTKSYGLLQDYRAQLFVLLTLTAVMVWFFF